MPIRRLEDTLTATTATIAGEDITASTIPVKPHIQPGVLQPAVAGKLLNGANHSGAYGTAQTQSGGDGHKYYYTDIKGSKPIKDPRIGAHFGSQRYTFRSMQKLEQETATHGEEIFSLDGRENIRVGNFPSGSNYMVNNQWGNFLSSNRAGTFLEITGYFNDINIIIRSYTASSRTLAITVNGVTAHSALDLKSTADSPLNASRYVSVGGLRNIDITSSSSLSSDTALGINTIKFTMPATDVDFHGIELIAQDTTSTTTRSQIQIPAQNVVSYGKKFTVSGTPHYNPFAQSQTGAAVTINSSTTNTAKLTGGWSGTGATYYSSELDTATSLGLSAWVSGGEYFRPVNGGRVVWWVNSSGSLKCSVNMMPPAGTAVGGVTSGHNVPTGTHNWATKYQPALHSTTIDHSQAEVAKTFHWREFGNGAANTGGESSWADPSMVHTDGGYYDVTYAMDDGLTTLSADDVRANTSTHQLIPNASGSYSYISFIGTGITTIHSTNNSVSNTTDVAQNLPYGTHILKVVRTADTDTTYVIDGITLADVVDSCSGTYDEISFHQPKKPPIPEDAVVLADYMLMANFVGVGAVGTDKISKGVRACSVSRDIFHDDNGSNSIVLAQNRASNLGFNIQTNAVESGNVVKAQYPCFGSNFAARGAHMDTRHKIYLGDTDKDGSSTKDNTDTNGSYLVYNDTETLGINLFGTRCHDGGSTTSYLESFEFGIPIHTSSHYQTFETPYLHELVGGDRNMEQNNLVVTADGKTWDEVTRDVSYLGASSGFHTATDGNGQTAHNSWVIWDTWRGGYAGNMVWGFNKNWAIAYDKVICLKDGNYQFSWHCQPTGDGSWNQGSLRKNGTQVLYSSTDPESSARGDLQYTIELLCKRGDFVQIHTLYMIKDDDTTYNNFQAIKVG